MGAYLGHLEGEPNEQFLAIGHGFQGALDAVDMLAQPDETSVRAATEPLRLRVRLAVVDGVLYLTSHEEPFAVASHDLLHLRANPGTGATGDALRSFGPLCKLCAFQHFENQECKVFLEPGEELDVALLADPARPGEGVLSVHFPDHLDLDGMTFVADLAEFDLMAVFPFNWNGRRYHSTPGHACVEGDEVGLYAACKAAGIKVPRLRVQ